MRQKDTQKITEESPSPIGNIAQPALTTQPQSSPSQQASPQSLSAKTAANSQISNGTVAQPAETRTISSPQESPISAQELRDAFKAIQARLDAQDQAIQAVISTGQNQASPALSNPGPYGFANLGAIEQQRFPAPQGEGGQVSGKDLLQLIMPFIQPQNPTDSLLQQFLTSSIQGAMATQQAFQTMSMSIAQAVARQAMGVKDKGIPQHDHQVRHKPPPTA